MATERVERRLAAILAADVVAYSRLIKVDEERTITALKTLHRDLIAPKITEHHGRIVKLMGDGMLAEFGSVVDAVRAATVLQQALVERNADVPDERRITFRMGINLGDVVIDESDIHGDGVNVAARLEALAEPNGICVSGAVYEQVRDRIKLSFEDSGERELKNIDRPVHVWRWSADTTRVLATATPRDRPLLSDRPSIAVLPFDNMSGDPEQEYFADGITEDIITELSKYSWLLVIARNTSFTFKGQSIDLREVGRKIGARYVMEGSIRKSGRRVRVAAQLIDATSGHHVWAQRYDRNYEDIFAVQDEIAESVAGSIQPELMSAEIQRARRKPWDNMATWDYVVRGRWHILRLSVKDALEAQRLLQEALLLDPECVLALAFLAYSHFVTVIFGWSENPGESISRGVQLAARAGELGENDAWVQCALGLGQFISKRPEKAIAHYRKAIELNPSFALGHGYLALQLAFAGEPNAAIEEAMTAIRLSPRDPELFHFYVAIGTAHFVAGRYADAVDWARKAVMERPSAPGPLRLLVTSLAHTLQVEEAREVFKRVLEITPSVTATRIKSAVHFGRSEYQERYIEGLRMAGLPE